MGSNMIHGDFTINSFATYSRPTHAFIFKLTTGNLTLRIFKGEEGKRYFTWIKPSNLNKEGLFNEVVQRPIIPSNNNIRVWLGKAHLVAPEDPKAEGHLVRPIHELESRGQKPIQRIIGEN